jgi:DNA invertase Pin-like site-specific DNA recombinase
VKPLWDYYFTSNGTRLSGCKVCRRDKNRNAARARRKAAGIAPRTGPGQSRPGYVASARGMATLRDPALVRQRMRDVAKLTAQGLSANEIAVQLWITQRTVVRYRGRIRDGELDRDDWGTRRRRARTSR